MHNKLAVGFLQIQSYMVAHSSYKVITVSGQGSFSLAIFLTILGSIGGSNMLDANS